MFASGRRMAPSSRVGWPHRPVAYAHRFADSGCHGHPAHTAPDLRTASLHGARLASCRASWRARRHPACRVGDLGGQLDHDDPGCSGVNVRTGPSTSAPVRTHLATSARVTVVATVSGSHWSTTCPGAKSGSSWYRISAINGKSVSSGYGQAYLYAATGVLGALPSATPASTDAFGNELTRLLNLDRVALGKKPYLVDARLAQIARDAPFTCPTNAAMHLRGRAQDLADRHYLSHTVPGCYSSGTTPFRSIEIVRSRVRLHAGPERDPALERVRHGDHLVPPRLRHQRRALRRRDDDRAVHGDPRPAQLHELGAAPCRGAELIPARRLRVGEGRRPDLLRLPVRRWRPGHRLDRYRPRPLPPPRRRWSRHAPA